MSARIYHIVDRIEVSDKATQDRLWKCQQSWEPLLERGDIVPCHFWPQFYPRTARETLGDSRPLPYLKDMLQFGMKQCKSDDVLLFTNSDNIIHGELPEYLRYHLSCLGPCSIFRTEFRGVVPSLELSAENFGKRSIERHVGRDGFSFTKAWLEDNWEELPDAVLGASMWDCHMAVLIRLRAYGIKTTNANIWQQILPAEIPLGYTGHIAHLSAWSVNQNASAANRWNGKLFLDWATKNLPELKVTPEGNLA